VNNYEQALKFIFAQIPAGDNVKFPGERGLARMEALLDELGRPEMGYKAIHIAATSGKGSTTTLATSILMAHGYKVGSTVSPHLKDIRERTQLDNTPCSKSEFVAATAEVEKSHEMVSKTSLGSPTYSEIMIAIALVVFRNAKVDFAVVETCLGGLYDTTNAMACEKVSVLGKIGLDHTHILGDTLEKIASQKAGIIRRPGPVVALSQTSGVNKVFSRQANSQNAELTWIDNNVVKNIKNEWGSYVYDLDLPGLKIDSIKLKSIGLHQVYNSALAVVAVQKLINNIDINVTKKALANTSIKGRFEEISLGQARIVIDAAHNPQKMAAFVQALSDRYGAHSKYTFLVSFKESKDYGSMLEKIFQISDDVTFTDLADVFQDGHLRSIKFSKVPEVYVQKMKYIANIEEAFTYALQKAQLNNKILVITGSMYLLGDVYSVIDKLKSIEQHE